MAEGVVSGWCGSKIDGCSVGVGAARARVQGSPRSRLNGNCILIDYKISLQGKVVRNRRRDLRLGGERKDGGLENGIDHLDRVPQESGLG